MCELPGARTGTPPPLWGEACGLAACDRAWNMWSCEILNLVLILLPPPVHTAATSFRKINSGTLMIPKVFLNKSDASEEAVKELTTKAATMPYDGSRTIYIDNTAPRNVPLLPPWRYSLSRGRQLRRPLQPVASRVLSEARWTVVVVCVSACVWVCV